MGSKATFPIILAGLLLAGGQAAPAQCPDDEEFTREFNLDGCSFSSMGANPYFSIEPGTRLVLEGEDDGEELVLEISALPATRWVRIVTESGHWRWVQTRIVREREWVGGELVEVSRNYFARCKETNDIYYFGEAVDIYEDGEITSHEGAWLAGKNGASPGLIMPGTFLLGSKYFQEIAPGIALDRAEHTAMGLTVTVPADSFEHCVEVTETNGLSCNPDGESKIYCRGIGLVDDAGAQLADYEIPGSDDEDED